MQKNTKSIIAVMTALLLSIAMLNVELSAIYVILPSLSHYFHANTLWLSWVVTLYMLAFGSFLVIGGRLGDIYGHRNTLLGGLTIFAIASLAGGLSGGFTMLLFSRFFQGVACALIWPNATALACQKRKKVWVLPW